MPAPLAVEHVAAYTIMPHGDGSFVDQHGNEFNVPGYSLVKYGETSVAWGYGRLLAAAAIEEVPDAVFDEAVTLTVPAYAYSPKPALTIGRSVLTHLSAARTAEGLPPARLLRLHTDSMGTTAYAQQTPEERQRTAGSWTRQHHIPTSLVEGASMFAVDDCVITGNTERKQVARLAAHNPGRIVCAYAVKVDPEIALKVDGLEHVLNMAATPDLLTIAQLIDEQRFALNSRVLDLILSTEDTDELGAFFDLCPEGAVRDMYEATVNSSVEFIGRYPKGFERLQNAIDAMAL
jgi:hypothetical protein